MSSKISKWLKWPLIFILFFPVFYIVKKCTIGQLSASTEKRYNDLYYQSAEARTVDMHKPRQVVLVNLGSAPQNNSLRESLLVILSKLHNAGPAAIGIDLYFVGKATKYDDSLLYAIKSTKAIYGQNGEQPSIFGDDIDKQYSAIINIPNAEYYYKKYKVGDDWKPSFAYRLFLEAKGKGMQPIDLDSVQHRIFLRYSCGEKGFHNILDSSSTLKTGDFPAIEAKDILEGRNEAKANEAIRGKIVILSWLGNTGMDKADAIDKHRVPMYRDTGETQKLMSGALIHANAIQMMFNGETKEVGFLWQLLPLALFMLCYNKLENSSHNWKPIVIMVFVTLIVALIVFFCSLVLMSCRYHFNTNDFVEKFLFMGIYVPYAVKFYRLNILHEKETVIWTDQHHKKIK